MADPNKRISLQDIKRHPWFQLKLPKELQVICHDSYLCPSSCGTQHPSMAAGCLFTAVLSHVLQQRANCSCVICAMQAGNFRHLPGNEVHHMQTEDEVRAVVAEARMVPP